MNNFTLVLQNKIEILPQLYRFDFVLEGGGVLDFVAGQYIFVDVANGLKRAYSIASKPGNEIMEFFINTDVGGPGSIFFENLQVGAKVGAKGPTGKFTFRSGSNPVVFVATGTGMAPFRSIIFDQLDKGSQSDFTLLFGARRQENLKIINDFEELATSFSNFKCLPTLTRGEESWNGMRGRVSTYLEGLELDPMTDYYLCGKREMVLNVRDILLGRGVPKEKMFFELY